MLSGEQRRGSREKNPECYSPALTPAAPPFPLTRGSSDLVKTNREKQNKKEPSFNLLSSEQISIIQPSSQLCGWSWIFKSTIPSATSEACTCMNVCTHTHTKYCSHTWTPLKVNTHCAVFITAALTARSTFLSWLQISFAQPSPVSRYFCSMVSPGFPLQPTPLGHSGLAWIVTFSKIFPFGCRNSSLLASLIHAAFPVHHLLCFSTPVSWSHGDIYFYIQPTEPSRALAHCFPIWMKLDWLGTREIRQEKGTMPCIWLMPVWSSQYGPIQYGPMVWSPKHHQGSLLSTEPRIAS